MTIYGTPSLIRKKFKQVTTISAAVEIDAPRLNVMIRETGAENVEKFIKRWLIDLNMTLDLSKPLSEIQIDFIAEIITQEYRDLSLADIDLIFKSAIKGDYGEFYENLNPPKVLRWFSDYQSERMEYCSMKTQRNHAQIKESPHADRNSEMTVKQFLKTKRK